MNENLRKTLKALVELGFDVKTGTSPMIFMKNLEIHSGLRQTSNGSRIVRRDSKVFSLFNIEWRYCEVDGRLISVKFLGYKTSEDIIDKLESEVLKWEDKILSLKNLIKENKVLIEQGKCGKFTNLAVEDLLTQIGEEY